MLLDVRTLQISLLVKKKKKHWQKSRLLDKNVKAVLIVNCSELFCGNLFSIHRHEPSFNFCIDFSSSFKHPSAIVSMALNY